MPGFCCVPGCAHDGTFQEGLSFHDLPTEKRLRKAWIHAIRWDVGRYFHIVPGSTKVCSIHFRDEDFRQPSASALARRRAKLKKGDEVATHTSWLLRSGAIPSIFPSFPKGPARKVRKPPLDRGQSSLSCSDDLSGVGDRQDDEASSAQPPEEEEAIDDQTTGETFLAAQVAALQEDNAMLQA